MEIDFHFGVTYVVGRLAGLRHDEAQIVATASQYVDDTVNSGTLRFRTGEAYSRATTAHKALDFHNLNNVDERCVWVPFHFIPGNQSEGRGDEFLDRMVCRPNSDVAQAMVRRCIENQDHPFALHQLGITAHVFMDTWRTRDLPAFSIRSIWPVRSSLRIRRNLRFRIVINSGNTANTRLGSVRCFTASVRPSDTDRRSTIPTIPFGDGATSTAGEKPSSGTIRRIFSKPRKSFASSFAATF